MFDPKLFSIMREANKKRKQKTMQPIIAAAMASITDQTESCSVEVMCSCEEDVEGVVFLWK
jgi:hypothetical protein